MVRIHPARPPTVTTKRRSTMSPHILALDVAGAPHRWINVRDAAHYYATDMIAWAIGTNEFVLRGGMQRATGLQSMIRARSEERRVGKECRSRGWRYP